LIKAQCIEPNKYDYTTFHRAIVRYFPNASIKGHDGGQTLYGKLIKMDKVSDLSTKAANEFEKMRETMFVKFVEAK
jgi:hypothetical protein